MKHSELTVRDSAGKPVASYSVEWGRNGGYWQGQVKNAAGQTVGQTSPISVFPGTNGAPPRASVTVEFTPSETQDLKTKAEPAETEMKRRGHGTGPLATTYGRTSTAMDKSADPCKDLPGARHHEVPAELMDRHADFLNEIGYSLDYGLSRPNARAPHSGEAESMIRLPTNEAERSAMSAIPGCGDRTIHNGSHPEYAKAVDEKLQDIKDQFNSGQLSKEEARAMVGRLLDGSPEFAPIWTLP